MFESILEEWRTRQGQGSFLGTARAFAFAFAFFPQVEYPVVYVSLPEHVAKYESIVMPGEESEEENGEESDEEEEDDEHGEHGGEEGEGGDGHAVDAAAGGE